MSKLAVTNFSKKTGSPFQKRKALPTGGTANKNKQINGRKIIHTEVLQKSNIVRQKSSMQNKSKESLTDTIKKQEEVEIQVINVERQSSPLQNEVKELPPITDRQATTDVIKNIHEEIVVHRSNFELQKEKQNELMQIVNKKTAEYQSNKPSSGVFTEVVTHGAFTSKTPNRYVKESTPPKTNGSNGSSSKSLLGFPSSANDLALDAKSDLESDANISNEVKGKVIDKLFALVSMVQHAYEAKVRIMTEFEKFKDTHMKNEIRREKEHSEQLYKLNMNFQNEVIQAIQRLESELDISRNVTKEVEDRDTNQNLKNTSVDFNTSDDASGSESNEKIDVKDENEEASVERVKGDANNDE